MSDSSFILHPSSFHVIRLRDPWDRIPPGIPPGASRPDVALAARRFFNIPTNLSPDESVWLCFDPLSSDGQATLNDQLLGPLSATTPTAFNITAFLLTRNELRCEFSTSDAAAVSAAIQTLTTSTRLEIRHKDKSVKKDG